MYRTSCIAIAGCFLAMAILHDRLNGQEVDLADANVNFEQLETLATRTYTVYRSQRHPEIYKGSRVIGSITTSAGWIRFKTKITPTEIVLEESWGSCCRGSQGGRISLQYLPNDLINLQKMVVWTNDQPEVYEMRRGEFDLVIDNEYQRAPWPRGVLMGEALLRYVSILPRTPGVEYKFPSFTTAPELNVRSKKLSTIRCVGLESICMHGEGIDCTRFTWQGNNYWVRNSDGVVLMVTRSDGTQMVLTDHACGESGLCH